MKFTQEVISTIKSFILDNIENHPNDIVKITMEHFGLSKPTVGKYLQELINDSFIVKSGAGRYPNYKLVQKAHSFHFENDGKISEDRVWTLHVKALVKGCQNNVLDISYYGISGMVNNVLDHSEAKHFEVHTLIDHSNIEFQIIDNGIGLFNKIQQALNLDIPKHAILELAKGKFTSDPERHSGEGIFFTSRSFDFFEIASGNITFQVTDKGDWLYEDIGEEINGTKITMRISKMSNKALLDVFDQFSDSDKNPSFYKTIVPVRLMQYEGESLISRSQAKRLITRFDKFLEVVLDFEGVRLIGQGFADEVFRVFQNAHPDVHLTTINTNEKVQKMIAHVVRR